MTFPSYSHKSTYETEKQKKLLEMDTEKQKELLELQKQKSEAESDHRLRMRSFCTINRTSCKPYNILVCHVLRQIGFSKLPQHKSIYETENQKERLEREKELLELQKQKSKAESDHRLRSFCTINRTSCKLYKILVLLCFEVIFIFPSSYPT